MSLNKKSIFFLSPTLTLPIFLMEITHFTIRGHIAAFKHLSNNVMQVTSVIMLVIGVLFLTQMTMVIGYQQTEEDESRFTLREVMEAIMKSVNCTWPHVTLIIAWTFILCVEEG
jgi:hypothetical protein